MKVDTIRCTSLISVSVAWVNWNEDDRLVKTKSIEDLWVFVKEAWLSTRFVGLKVSQKLLRF